MNVENLEELFKIGIKIEDLVDDLEHLKSKLSEEDEKRYLELAKTNLESCGNWMTRLVGSLE